MNGIEKVESNRRIVDIAVRRTIIATGSNLRPPGLGITSTGPREVLSGKARREVGGWRKRITTFLLKRPMY